MTKEQYKDLYYEENPEAWLGMAENDEQFEYAVMKITTSNVSPLLQEAVIELYEERFGKPYDLYGEEEKGGEE